MLELAEGKSLLHELAAVATTPERPVDLITISFELGADAQDAPVSPGDDSNRAYPHARRADDVLELCRFGVGVRRTLDGHVDILISQIALQLEGLEQHSLLRVQARHRRAADGIHELLERGPVPRPIRDRLSMDRVRLPQVVQQVGLAPRCHEVERTDAQVGVNPPNPRRPPSDDAEARLALQHAKHLLQELEAHALRPKDSHVPPPDLVEGVRRPAAKYGFQIGPLVLVDRAAPARAAFLQQARRREGPMFSFQEHLFDRRSAVELMVLHEPNPVEEAVVLGPQPPILRHGSINLPPPSTQPQQVPHLLPVHERDRALLGPR
mmetsp:Transcript_7470/g.22170  ORF Transcript_7470/g.22170 Transcript_7470/m.22170 type:complete len:323 (-) Transcript_7470:466-1434(-)